MKEIQKRELGYVSLAFNTIYYIESLQDLSLNSYVLNHIEELNRELNYSQEHLFNYQLIFVPQASLDQRSLIDLLALSHPETDVSSIQDNTIDLSQSASLFEGKATLFCRFLSPNYNDYEEAHFLVDNLEEHSDKDFSSSFNRFVEDIDKRNSYDGSFFPIVESPIRYRLVNDVLAEDIDEETFQQQKKEFEERSKKKRAWELARSLQELQRDNGLHYLLELTGIEICKPIELPEPVLSRLTINDDMRLFLNDYQNLEIKMEPLPKTLYILFLRHPEGIRLKEIIDYRKELLLIYKNVSSSENNSTMERRIDELIDTSGNSLYKNIARMRAAFLKQLSCDIAELYLPTGERGEKLTIKLDISLIHLPKMQKNKFLGWFF